MLMVRALVKEIDVEFGNEITSSDIDVWRKILNGSKLNVCAFETIGKNSTDNVYLRV